LITVLKKITDEHKIAAAKALASLVSEPSAKRIIPSPFDDGVVEVIAKTIT
jgi:malate dehydrogenase (oxaloacetate-decarboxylating)